MRNILIFLFAGLVIFSCTDTPAPIPPGFLEKTLCITDEHDRRKVGQVSIAIPAELDTLLIWADASDDARSTIKHRFVNKKGCLLQESGFFKIAFCEDSTIRLTIIGYKYSRSTNLKTFVKDYIERDSFLFRDIKASIYWKSRRFERYGNQEFAILHSVRDEPMMHGLEMVEVIALKNDRFFKFYWECAGADCTEFFKKAYQSIPTIQIDTICKQ
jgi:hypothetical protein